MSIRVQMADDHEVVREGIRRILGDEPDIQVIDSDIVSGDQLISLVEQGRADILLLDLKMPRFNLLTALPQLATLQKPRVIVITAQYDPLLIRTLTDYGVAGFLLKEESLSKMLPEAIREVTRGGVWFSPKAQGLLLASNTSPDYRLSLYEKQVLTLMSQGQTPTDIAGQLGRTIHSVYSAQEEIRLKLEVTNNEGAIVKAITQRLIPLQDADTLTPGV